MIIRPATSTAATTIALAIAVDAHRAAPSAGAIRAGRGRPATAAKSLRRHRDPVQPLEQQRGRVAAPALRHGLGQQPAGQQHIAGVERRPATVHHLLRLALPFGQRTAGALDVRAGLAVAPLQEGDTGPDVDRLFVLSREIVIEPRQQELLDTGGALAFVDVGRRSLRRSRPLAEALTFEGAAAPAPATL